MEMVLVSDTLFVDLCGEVNVLDIKNKLCNVTKNYNIDKIIVDVSDVFNYKKRNFKELSEDFSRVYNCDLKIVK